jgi:ComF family protein
VVDPPPFVRASSYGLYEGALKEAIHLLKFNGHRRLAKPLASLLADIEIPEVDVLMPVPIHLHQLRTREFNQTALIAKHLSVITRIPLMIDGLTKVKDTAAQIDVDRKERLRNLKKAFFASEQVKGRRILLVDDVITTGATMRECTRTLIKAGALEVVVIALARSMPKW